MNSPQQIIKACANGNAYAESFLGHFWVFAHALDDCVDKPERIDDQNITRAIINLIVDVAHNPFFEQNKHALIAILQLSAAAWLDSNQMARSGIPEQRLAADVLKGAYHEVFWFTALKTGGWDYMRSVTKEYREFDFEQKGDS